MNKILGLAAGVSMLAMVAMPVMARDYDRGNGAVVVTSVNTTSNTGGNNTTVNGSGNANGYNNIAGTTTGSATSQTLVLTGANVNLGESRGGRGSSNFAYVRTSVNTTSNTGGNNTTVNGSGNANGSTNFVGTSTGNAVSKTAVVNVVNTNISFNP